jgi:superfamily II DNA or RNA helicase
MAIKTTIDHKLRVRLSDLPIESVPFMLEALNIPNIAKQKARKMDEWGWQEMPDTICLYEITQAEDGSEILVMPRGFLADFAAGMNDFGAQIELVEGRYWEPLFRVGRRVRARPWQKPQIESIFSYEQGIIKSPAGSGKTVAILAAIQQLGCSSLIIINTKDILWQWIDRVRTFLGEDYPIGQIGDGIFQVSPYITIATAQTLHSRFDDLEQSGFFDDYFSLVCLDECHHATAGTYNKLLDRFSARYRVGVSATPDKTGDFALAVNVLGPIIHTTRPSEVTTLTKPSVVRVSTNFRFNFVPHRNRWQRSNYPQMIDALIRDPGRNMMIVRNVMAEQGHHQLLVSKRLEHLEFLQFYLEDAGFPDPITTITGRDKNDHRQAAVELAASQPCLILSTLADEAMDIPRLDRLHLTFPQRNTGLITQQVGRVERQHPDKRDAKIYDYADVLIAVFQKHWKMRRMEVYEPRGYAISVQTQ